MAWDTIVKTSVDAVLDAEDFDLDELTDERVAELADAWVNDIRNEELPDCWRVELNWFEAYANGDSAGDKGILAANWNRVSRGVQKVLERAGYTLDWCDAVSGCDSCHKAIQTRPTHYGWKPEYVTTECEMFCEDCTVDDPSYLLDDLRGNEDKALTLDGIDLADHGYTRVEQTFENGFHPGQDDSPKAIARNLRERGVEDFIFSLDSVGQFDARFSVWVPVDDLDRAQDVTGKCEVPPNVALAQALQSIPPSTGEGIQYNRVNGDGTVTTTYLTPEQFIEGVRE